MSWQENDYVLDLPRRPVPELNAEEQLRRLTRKQQSQLLTRFPTNANLPRNRQRSVPENVESKIMNMVLGTPPNRNYARGEPRPRSVKQRLNNINRRRIAHEEAIAEMRSAELAQSLAFQQELQAQLNLEQEELNREAAVRAEIEEAERRQANYEAQISERPANIRNRESIRQYRNRMHARNVSRQKRGKSRFKFGNTSRSKNYQSNGPKTNKRNKKEHTKRRNRK